MIGLPALKYRGRVLAGGLLLTTAAAIAAIAAPAASAAPFAPATSAASAASLAPATPVSGDSSGPIVFSAVGATPKGANGRYEFVYTNIKPGSVIHDWVELFNRSSQTAGFEVYGVDATGTTLGGSYTFDTPSQKPKDIGTWETFYASPTEPTEVQASFVMGGGHGIIEPFTITVPQTAPPGDHTGGLIVQVSTVTTNSKNERVTIYSRIVLPIEIRVTGPLTAGLQVSSVSTSVRNSLNPFGTTSASISYTVANLGNTRLRANQVVQVTGLFGGTTIKPPHLPTILPGDSLRVTQTVAGLYPLGPFTAKVTVTPTWPSAASAAPGLTLKTVNSSASFFALPWALIVIILLLAGLGYGTYRFLRWRVRERAADMAAVAEAARKDAERRLSGKTASAAKVPAAAGGAASPSAATGTPETTATATGGATATATDDGTPDVDGEPDSHGEAE